MNLYFIFNFLSWFHDIYIYIYIYIYICVCVCVCARARACINAYLFKHFNFISAYDGLFSNFSCYKCLYNNAFEYFKIMHKCFLKYVLKNK